MGYQLSKVKKKHGRAVFAVAALKTDQSSSSGQLACLDIFSHLKLWYIVAIWFALGRLVLCQSWLRYWDAKKLTKTRSPLATISTEAVFAPRNHHKSHKDFNFKLERDTKKLATLFSPLFKKTMDV